MSEVGDTIEHMILASIQATSSRQDSSGTCCKQDCLWLGSTVVEVLQEERIIEKKDKDGKPQEEKVLELSYKVKSRCLKHAQDLNVSFGLSKRCFECISRVK